MRVALVTCRTLPRADPELPTLVDAFARRGIAAAPVAWDDEGVAWSGFDVALIRSTWNYVQNLERYLAWLANVSTACTLVNGVDIVRWNLHKRYLLELAAADVPVVPTQLVAAGEFVDLDRLFGAWGELVLKPAISAGSFQTVRVAAGDHAAAAAHLAENAARDMLIQPALPSVLERGERNMVFFRGSFSHAIHKRARWKGDPEASAGTIEPDADEIALAERVFAFLARRGLGCPSYARVDVARDRHGGAVLMELELIEPSLFVERVEGAADRLVDAVRASWDDGRERSVR